jgi:ATP-dependent DNA helicase UvrD/PcrA
MRKRLELEGLAPDLMPNVRTLHSKAVALIRQHCTGLSLNTAVRPLSELEAKLLVQDVAAHLADRNVRLSFKGQGSVPSYLRAYQSEQGGAGVPSWISQDGELLRRYREFADAYESLQKFYSALDWFMVVELALQLFDSYPDILTEEQASIDHLLVDEYQDLNRNEQEFIRRLARDPRGLCIVGDEDQSIYETRRFADPAGIITFNAQYPGSTTLPLTYCHRCPTKVIAKANALIEKNTRRIQGKTPLQAMHPDRTGVVATVPHRSMKAETEWLVRKVKELPGKGCPYKDVLILFGDGTIAEGYVKAFEEHNVPLDVKLRIAGPFDSPCFLSVMAVLRFLVDQSDNLAVRQCLDNWPQIGAITIRSLRKHAVQGGVSLWQAVVMVAQNLNGSPSIARRRSVEQFHAAMSQLLSIPEFHRIVSAILAILSDCADDPDVKIVNEYLARRRGQESLLNLADVLQSFEIEREQGKFETEEEEPEDKVRVMTMHSSKGLEAKVVFLPALEDDLMPGEVQNLEERRRLFFVSITRSKQVLCLTWAKQRTGQAIHRPGGRMLGKKRSRFLDDMGA